MSSLAEAVVIARKDKNTREQLIKKFMPFVTKISSRVANKFVAVGEDDEFSIGLIAFNKAIDSYKPETNASFLKFAEMVIRSRIIDFYRREKDRNTIPFSALETDSEEGGSLLELVQSEQDYNTYLVNNETLKLRDEIESYSEALAKFGIDFRTLTHIAPKHDRLREDMIRIAKLIVSDNDMKSYLLNRKALPTQQILKHIRMSDRNLRRQKPYIIAVCLVLLGNYRYLKSYVR